MTRDFTRNPGSFRRSKSTSKYHNLSKYVYEDSGLACNMADFRMKNYREKWDVIQEVEENKRNSDSRFFPEYSNIHGRDIVVSIEYWLGY